MAVATVIAPNVKNPGTYIQVLLGVGPRASGTGARTVVLFGNKLSSGSMNIEQEYPVSSVEEAEALAGSGSELHVDALAAITANPSVALSIIAIAESAGANATRSIAFTGTATTAGTAYLKCLGEVVQVPYASGDTATVIAARCATYVGYKSYWPITGSAATGTLTATAKQKGPRGNFIRFAVWVDANTGVSVPAVAADFLLGGTTSDSPQNALDVMGAVDRTYFALPYSDSTNLGLVRAHLDAQDEPMVGHRKSAIAGSIDTLANTVTLAVASNFPRSQIAWQYNSDVTPGMQAAALAATRALRESLKVSRNHDGAQVVGIPVQHITSWQPTDVQVTSALDNGVTPLVATNDGRVVIARSITTKSQDSGGRPDYRVLDTTKVVVSDELAARITLQFADKTDWNADNDPPDGVPLAPETMTPSLMKQELLSVIQGMEDDGHLSKGSALRFADQVQVDLSAVSQGRFNAVVPFDVVEGFHQTSVQIRQVG